MEQEKENASRSWAEKHVPTIFGLGVLAMLGLISVFMGLFG